MEDLVRACTFLYHTACHEAIVHIFGSSASGFASCDSDIDLCLELGSTYANQKEARRLKGKLVWAMEKKLRWAGFTHVQVLNP